MPPAVNYDDARQKLEAGAGGIFIPSWADPNLLTEEGRNIVALREELDRDFKVSIDFEGGRVQRFSEVLGAFPAPQQMAADGSPEDVERIGAEIGGVLKAHGINVDFAPVLDVDGGGLEVVGTAPSPPIRRKPVSMAQPLPAALSRPASKPCSNTSQATGAPRGIPTWLRP